MCSATELVRPGADGWNRTTVAALRVRRTATCATPAESWSESRESNPSVGAGNPVPNHSATPAERAPGLEPGCSAWKADAQPMSHARKIKKATQHKLGGLEILTTLGVRLADTRACSWRTARR